MAPSAADAPRPRAAADLQTAAGAAAAADADADANPTTTTTTTEPKDRYYAPLPEKFNVWDAVGRCLQPVLRAGVACGPPLKLPADANKPRLPPSPPLAPLPETPRDRLDAELARLSKSARVWRALNPMQRAALMDATLRTFLARMDALAEATAEVRGTGDMGVGEDYASLVPVVMALADFRSSLRVGGKPRPLALWKRRRGQLELEEEAKAKAAAVDGGEAPSPPSPPKEEQQQQWVAKVFPEGMTAIMYPGFSGEVWLTPGADPTQGRIYREKEAAAGRQKQKAPADDADNAGAALVLGAGNQLAVACMDALHKLVVDDETVLLKFNPVNERAGPIVEQAFAPLADFVGYAYGGAEVGRYLTRHALVRSIHLTGSAQTYNAIAWGDPRGAAAFLGGGGGGEKGGYKAAAAPTPPPDSPLARGVPVGAELGNVTPYVIVPGGEWSESDLRRHADNVVSGMINNCGHNCLAGEVIVTDRRWPLRGKFLAAVRERLARSWRRVPYYPGSAQKLAAFRAAFPDAEELGRVPAPVGGEAAAGVAAAAGVVPWLLKAGLTAQEARVSEENWCGVVQEVALEYDGGSGSSASASQPDVPAFLRAAAAFCNRRCWGTLAASVFAHPSVERSFPQEFDDFLGALRYGSVSVNCPALGAFAVASLGWGAFAAEGTPERIGTGNCVVHNTFLFDHPQKSVLRAPWSTAPAQLWSVNQANLQGAVPAAARFVDAQGDGRPLGALAWVTLAAWRAVRGTVGRTC